MQLAGSQAWLFQIFGLGMQKKLFYFRNAALSSQKTAMQRVMIL